MRQAPQIAAVRLLDGVKIGDTSPIVPHVLAGRFRWPWMRSARRKWFASFVGRFPGCLPSHSHR